MCKVLTCLVFKLLMSLMIPSSVRGKGVNNDNIHANTKGWLRVCHPNSKTLNHYEVEAETCPHGTWLSESLPNGCICLNGMWAISQGWCDEDYYVAYGKGDCFNLEFPVKKLTFLGNAHNAFEPTNFVTKENGHVFQSISNEFVMPYEFSRNTNSTILRLQPSPDSSIILEMKAEQVWQEELLGMDIVGNDITLNVLPPLCLKPDFQHKWEENALMIYKIQKSVSYIKLGKQCPKQSHPANKMGMSAREEEVTKLKIFPGQAIHVKSGKIIHATKNCTSSCHSHSPGTPPPIRHKRQALDVSQLDRDFTIAERNEIVRTSNLRVVKQELSFLLHGKRPPFLGTLNWKLARKVKNVFVKACPNKETPKFLVNAMMRLFRMFYLNSKDFYPNGHMLQEKAQIERMMHTLDLCMNDASEFKFQYNLTKVEPPTCRYVCQAQFYISYRLENDTDTNTTSKYCKCKEVLGFVNVSYALNMTAPVSSYIVPSTELKLSEDLAFLLPGNDSLSGIVHDFPTETLWKLISFAHFFCAKHFQYNPGDFSALMTRLEELFNEDIIYRWTNPGTASYTVWQYLYSAFDLKKFAKAVDACVGVAKYVSAYPEWLNRPTLDIKRRRKRSLDNAKLWKGTAYCLDDPWDPVNKLGIAVGDKCVDLNRY